MIGATFFISIFLCTNIKRLFCCVITCRLLVIFVSVMAKVFIIIGFLFLALFAGLFTNVALCTDPSWPALCEVAEGQWPSLHDESECYTMPLWPCLPDAEMAVSNDSSQFGGSSRMQRSAVTEYLYVLKERVSELARYETVRSQFQWRFYEGVSCCFRTSVCDYIIILRRLLI